MALKISGENVQMTRKGAGVILNVSFKELELWAARNRLDAPRLWERSLGRACKSLRDKMQKVVSRSGGVEGVPKFKDFEAFTISLRQAKGKTAPMGGVLADRGVIVAYKRGDTQYIGWPDRLAEWAVKFQDAVGNDFIFTDAAARRRFHRLGIKDIPRSYIHNPRPVIPEPFGSYVKKYLIEWARHIFYKTLARQMAKK